MSINRRRFLSHSAASAGVLALSVSPRASAAAAPAVVGTSNSSIKSIEQIFTDIPFTPVPGKHQYREIGHEERRFHTFIKVQLANGVTGFGEGDMAREARPRLIGRPAAEHLWDDSVGTGVQVALFDAVAKTEDVPVHRLLGRLVRPRAEISWWAVDMPGKDWVLECQEAVSNGYTSLKAKARPWFDLIDQLDVLTPTLPKHFRIDFDFNGMLLDSAHASKYFLELERFPNIDIYETPIPQGDVLGYQLLRGSSRIPIAIHFGDPPIMTALQEGVCDGFVIGGGASRVLQDGAIAAAANKSFWLQLTGSGVTTVWAIHLAAVLSHARWPAINLHHMHVAEMVKPAIEVANGSAAVPEGPGLGYSLDEDALEKYRIERLPKLPTPNKLYAIRWPSGATSYYRNADEFRADFVAGKLQVFPRGVYMEEIPDDGSAGWKQMHAKVQSGGVHSNGRPM